MSNWKEGTQAGLFFGAIGVVFGDIGTSPLYALRVAFSGSNALAASPGNILGILSLMFWSLVIVVGLKYALFVMRADNKGEGGIIALMSLALRGIGSGKARIRRVITLLGLLGTSLFFGDAIIAPAISVMSAVEGVKVLAPALKPLIAPVTLFILIALFMLQRRGSYYIGWLFSPVMVLWFLVLAGLGVSSIIKTPAILRSLNPGHAVDFLMMAKAQSLIVLGAVVLVVTGAEALYADMGHFGVSPIRRAWFCFVFPALSLNYLGQGALLMRDPSAASNPFYLLAPEWSLIPLLALATLSTIIAAQAVISGTFSLAWQAVQLGYLPRISIRHTSMGKAGQIYVPSVNWVLAVSIAALVLGFGSSSKLAAAYGIAVTGTMVVTTLLGFGLLRRMWRGGAWLAGLAFVIFLLIDLSFLVANGAKISHGGWVPLIFGGLAFLVLSTWKRGREVLLSRLHDRATPLEDVAASQETRGLPRVPGTAIYLTASRFGAPVALMRNMRVNKILHECVVILTVVTRDEPWVPMDERIKIRHFGADIYRVRIYYGYNQEPDIPDALGLCQAQGLPIDLGESTFFLAREHMVSTERPGMARWRERLFIRMVVNAESAVRSWHIPPDRVLEFGMMVEL